MKVELIVNEAFRAEAEISNPEVILEASGRPDMINIKIVSGVGPQGPRGSQGEQGIQGDRGEPGYTPVRGTDYWTVDDQQAVIQAAIDAVLDVYPAAEGVEW